MPVALAAVHALGPPSGSAPAPPPQAPRAGWRLSTKLIAASTLVVAVTVLAVLPVALIFTERQREREVLLAADQLSRALVGATWDAMLRDRRDEVYRALELVAREQDIERIRVYDHNGRLAFSTGIEGHAAVDLEASSCAPCHERGAKPVDASLSARSHFVPGKRNPRVLALITPIPGDSSCSSAGCHTHPAGRRILGVLDVHVALTRVDRELASARLRAVVLTLAILGTTSLFTAVFVRRFVGRPVARLTRATQAVASMCLDTPVPVETHDELGQLASSFNIMRDRLRTALDELAELADGLERKVEERTRQLETARETLLRRERLASLGQLSAGVAHEINNPLAGVLNYTMLMERILKRGELPPERVEEFRGYLEQVAQETARVGRIVTSLLTFARQGSPQRRPHALGDLVHETLGLLQHKLGRNGVRVHIEIPDELPALPCDGAQIRQVVMNLVVNAAESMPGGGPLWIRARRSRNGEALVLEVEDRGSGVAPEAMPRIFDPFFTTKADGAASGGTAQGTGLGLTVVYGIVTAHGGTIDFDSPPGQGTRVTVRLPLSVPPPAPDTPQGKEATDGRAATDPRR